MQNEEKLPVKQKHRSSSDLSNNTQRKNRNIIKLPIDALKTNKASVGIEQPKRVVNRRARNTDSTQRVINAAISQTRKRLFQSRALVDKLTHPCAFVLAQMRRSVCALKTIALGGSLTPTAIIEPDGLREHSAGQTERMRE